MPSAQESGSDLQMRLDEPPSLNDLVQRLTVRWVVRRVLGTTGAPRDLGSR